MLRLLWQKIFDRGKRSHSCLAIKFSLVGGKIGDKADVLPAVAPKTGNSHRRWSYSRNPCPGLGAFPAYEPQQRFSPCPSLSKPRNNTKADFTSDTDFLCVLVERSCFIPFLLYTVVFLLFVIAFCGCFVLFSYRSVASKAEFRTWLRALLAPAVVRTADPILRLPTFLFWTVPICVPRFFAFFEYLTVASISTSFRQAARASLFEYMHLAYAEDHLLKALFDLYLYQKFGGPIP